MVFGRPPIQVVRTELIFTSPPLVLLSPIDFLFLPMRYCSTLALKRTAGVVHLPVSGLLYTVCLGTRVPDMQLEEAINLRLLEQ